MTPTQQAILDDPFHRCALQAGLIAYVEGKLDDSEYVRRMAYEFYEEDLAKRNTTKHPTTKGTNHAILT